MSDAGGKIKIDGDASGFVAATGEVKKAAEGLNESLKNAIGGGAKAAEKSMVAMSQEGRKACKRLNAGIINVSTYVMGAQAGLNLLSRAWGKFGDVIKSGEDVGRVTRRLEAFTGGRGVLRRRRGRWCRLRIRRRLGWRRRRGRRSCCWGAE